MKQSSLIYFNPSFETGINEKYRIYDYTPLFNNNYYLKKDYFTNTNHELNKIEIKTYKNNVKELYNSLFMYGLNKSIYA